MTWPGCGRRVGVLIGSFTASGKTSAKSSSCTSSTAAMPTGRCRQDSKYLRKRPISILRRAAMAGDISADMAWLAHTDLVGPPLGFFPHQPCAAPVWELPENVTCYAGWDVA